METKYAQAKVGLMVLVAMAIVVFTILWGKSVKLTQTYRSYEIYFDNVLGLEKGALVLVNGVSKGRVKNFMLSNGGVMVEISIAKDVSFFTDAYAIIEIPGFMEEKVVVIVPGSSGQPFPKGERLPGISPPSLSQVFTYLNDLGDNLGSTLKEISAVSSGLKSIVSNPEFVSNVNSTTKNLADVTKSLQELIDTSKPLIDSTLDNASALSARVLSLVSRNETDIDTIISNLVKLSDELNQMTITVNEFTRYMNNENSSLGKLLNSDELYQDLRRVTANLDSLITEFRTHGIKTKLKIF